MWFCEPAFGFEISYTGSRPGHFRRFFLHLMRGGPEYQPMTEREASTETMMRLPGQSLELLRVFIKASKIFTLVFIFVFGQAA